MKTAADKSRQASLSEANVDHGFQHRQVRQASAETPEIQAAGLINHRAEAFTQRSRQALVDTSPSVVLQQRLQESVNTSPRMVAQRKRVAATLGAAPRARPTTAPVLASDASRADRQGWQVVSPLRASPTQPVQRRWTVDALTLETINELKVLVGFVYVKGNAKANQRRTKAAKKKLDRIGKCTKDAAEAKRLLEIMPNGKSADDLIAQLEALGDDATTNIAPLTLAGNVTEISPLLWSSIGPANLLRLAGVAAMQKKGRHLLAAVDVTDLATLEGVITTYPGATPDEIRGYATQQEITKAQATVNPAGIRFTQRSISDQGEGYSVSGNIRVLGRAGALPPSVPPARVFVKKPAMDAWGPLSAQDFNAVGDPKNLEDGQVYTLDNRRVYAYQQAGVLMPKPQVVPDEVARRERWKFSTRSQGTSIMLN